jgi:hypothetical protein
MLIQETAVSNRYCTTIDKAEAILGNPLDTVLACQDGDNMTATYIDPVYLEEVPKTVSLFDNTPTVITFTTTDGDTLSSFNEGKHGNSFLVVVQHKSLDINVIDTLQVTLVSESGDTEVITVRETYAGSGVYVGEADFGFTTAVQPGNGQIEGLLDVNAVSNSEDITATIEQTSRTTTVTASYIPVARAWIVDGTGIDVDGDLIGDPDGKGDTIYIEFEAAVYALPDMIRSINWPSEENDTRAASLTGAGGLGKIDTLPGSNGRIIIITWPSETDEHYSPRELDYSPFDTNKTSAVFPYPTLQLPEGVLFQGQVITLEDGMGPVVSRAEKVPADGSRYYDGENDVYKNTPDTLLVTFSEKIYPLPGASWDSLLKFIPDCRVGANPLPVITFEEPRPVPGTDSLQWKVVITNDPTVYKPKAMDCVYMDENARFTDAKGNIPEEKDVVIIGIEQPPTISDAFLNLDIEGIDLNSPEALILLNRLQTDVPRTTGMSYEYLTDSAGNIISDNTGQPVKRFFPTVFYPYGMDHAGNIHQDLQQACIDPIGMAGREYKYPMNCWSSVIVYSEGPYTVSITIYDNLGTFVHSSKQRFGYCGEMEVLNSPQNTPLGWRSTLFWNQKDLNGQYVGSGVYVWKVQFTSEGREAVNDYYKQGIYRSGDPAPDCVTNTPLMQ